MISALEENFEIFESSLAHYSRAIGHPVRIVILQTMLRRGQPVEGEIIEVPQLSKATVIQHLRELKRAGLISGKIFGTKARYWVDEENLKIFAEYSRQFFERM